MAERNDLEKELAVYVWGKAPPNEATEWARFVLNIPAIKNLINQVAALERDLAAARKALEAMESATEPIAIADENDVTSEDGYVSINKNTRKAIMKARALIAAARRKGEV